MQSERPAKNITAQQAASSAQLLEAFEGKGEEAAGSAEPAAQHTVGVSDIAEDIRKASHIQHTRMI